MIFRSVQSLFITFTLVLVIGVAGPLTYSGYVLMDDIIRQSGIEALTDKLSSLILPINQRYERLQKIGLEDSQFHQDEIRKNALKTLSNYHYKDSGSVFVLSEDGRMVISQDFSTNENINNRTFVSEIMAVYEGEIEYSEKGIGKLAVFRYYKPWNETIGLSIKKSELFAARDMFLRIILVVLVMTLLLSTISILLLRRRIIKPLIQLADCANEITHGNFDGAVNSGLWGEFSTVQQAFDAMRIGIKDKVTRIEEQLNIIQLKEGNLSEAITELEQSEAQVRLLLGSTAEAIFGLDMEGNCTFANTSCVRMLGYQDATELVGYNMHQLVHYKHRDGTTYPEDECPSLQVIKSGEGIHLDTEVFWRADGSSFPVDYWSYPILFDGEITGVVVTFMDITERKRAEKYLLESSQYHRMLFDESTTGLALCRMDGQLVDINNAYADIIGQTVEKTLDLKYWDITPEKYAVEEQVQLDMLNDTGRYGPYEKEYIHKDGHLVPVQLSGQILEKDGEKFIWSSVEDITERKQTDEALRRSQKMDAIGQLTGGIAHDFNNLLGVVLGNLELLESQIDDDSKAYKRITSIQKAAQRAVKLTKQLLGFSRSKPAQMVVTDINQLVGGMDSLLSRSLTPEITVEHQFDDELWLTNIDPGDLEDAMLNLSINARDAMRGRGHLTIETRNTTLDTNYCAQHSGTLPGEYVEISISDSGEGIPSEKLEHIFEPFFTTKDTGKGTGLGLAMVFGFINRSKGCIHVDSELGIGTTFHLYLPRNKGEEEQLEPGSQGSEVLPGEGETILVVDDEIGLLEMAQELLEMLGYRVLSATDGHQALQQLSEDPTIDLLFSDVVMPGGINGYELAEQATNLYPELKVLLTSGYTGKAAGIGQSRLSTNLLSKPYSQAELSKRVRAVLDE